MALIETEAVSRIYQLGKTEIHALQKVSVSIDEGEFVCIVGPSGCGKTTLLNIIGCIDRPTSGRVRLDGRQVDRLNDNAEADTRLHTIGFIFQSFNLIPVLEVSDNIAFPMVLAKVPKAERQRRTAYLIDLVGLSDAARHKPDELSGGQRQRVAIARALANNPRLVIADEPTANLDSETGKLILQAMKELNEKERVTFLFSTHDPMIMEYADRKIHLLDGAVQKEER
jgi:putative ABC transport system ATP-binding protein